MTAPTTTWGSYTLVNPIEFPGKPKTLGSSADMSDGTLKKEVIANKWHTPAKWNRLLAAELSTLYTAYLAYQVPPGGLFTFPDGAAKTMVGDDWEQVPIWYQAEGIFRYDVSLILSEV